MAAPPFSRLQLAAALLEYDNDPSDPEAPHRSAHESAIFAHLRRNVRPGVVPRKSDYLGVSLPSETGSLGGRESALDGRRSRSSTDALRNPFKGDDHTEYDEEDNGGELEVDLTSWGLDAFMSKDKEAKKIKGKGRLPNPHPVQSVHSHQPQTNTNDAIPIRRTTRSLSAGNYDHLFLSVDEHRRKSFGSPLDLAGLESPDIPFPRKPPSPSSNVPDQQQSIPFPTTSTRSPSPFLDDQNGHHRTLSTDSRILLNDDGQRHARTLSAGSMTSHLLTDDNPFALRPPSRASRFDPKAALHARTISNASMATRMLLDDAASFITDVGPVRPNTDRHYSTIELLRPKVLVMPSPLQSVKPTPPRPEPKPRDGFQISTDGPPLPPGARSTRRVSTFIGDPIASNSFTPNPRANLSLSQLTFRNTLLIDGQRDVAFSDIDVDLPRATEDGQQVRLEGDVPEPVQEPPITDDSKISRPPGKLYGKSLIDDLEDRKAQMRAKQRVFTGDSRPSMMNRSSTLIDPASLQAKPNAQRTSSYGLNPTRRNSVGQKPLLSFDDKEAPLSASLANPAAKSPSVFGVDTLWQREMAKLKEIEAQEEREAAEKALIEAEQEQAKAKKKGKKKGKHHGTTVQAARVEAEPELEPEPEPEPEAQATRVSIEPPVLPAIRSAIRGPPPPVDDDNESESDGDDSAQPRRISEKNAWNAGSSDEEADPAPRRTTGVGPRFPSNTKRSAKISDSNESDEDLPLVATLRRATKLAAATNPDSDDETQPLSAMLHKAKTGTGLPPMNFGKLSLPTTGEDDDEPLGLRASRVIPSSHVQSENDDDKPLGLHPEQQRRTQYQLMAQQHQQQQMLFQAQMHNSMFFNPSMMGSGFFAPPMASTMMLPPVPVPSPPPMQDPTKFGRVDRWRHDVAGT